MNRQLKVRGRKRSTRGAVVLASFAWMPAIGIGACERGVQLETRTFELQHLNPGEAVEMVRPYVFQDREGAPGVVTAFSAGITVRETPESLARIGEVLARYDRAKPAVRMHVQVIEADGFTQTDPRIAEVRGALEELFRFEGYRLVGEAQLAGMEGTGSEQALSEGDRRFLISGSVDQVRVRGEGGSATLTVHMRALDDFALGEVGTTLSIPVGETVVLGSTRPRADQPTLILTVRPEFITLPDSAR